MLKLTYSNLEFQNFPGENPRTSSRGGEGRGGEEREGKRKGRRGRGKGREGREGQGREGGEEWGLGRGGALDMGSPPSPRDKLWICPW